MVKLLSTTKRPGSACDTPGTTWKVVTPMLSESTSGLTCSVPDCDCPHKARGFCRRHYERFMRYGDPLAPRPPASSELRQRRSIAQKERIARGGHPFAGKQHTAATRAKMRESHLGERAYWYGKSLSEETRAKISESLSHWWQSDDSAELRKYRASEEFKKARREDRLNDTPETVAKRARALCPEPNKPEAALLTLLDALFPDTYRFTGNGDAVIGRYAPDFTAIVGPPRVIEMFGDYWHRGQNPADRIGMFAGFGYAALVVWEHEVKDIDTLAHRLVAFEEQFTD